mgnify:CR=1 FL=1
MCENQQEQIVRCAAEKFGQFGIRSVSIDDICREVNISKKTFYVYFRQKEDLIEAVLKYVDKKISAMMTEKLADKSALECVRLFVSMPNDIKELQNQPPLMYDLKKYYSEIYKAHEKEITTMVRGHMLNHLNKGINEGIYRSDLDVEACASYITLVHQSWVSEIFDPQYVSKERLFDFMSRSLLRSMLSERGTELVNKQK